MTSGNTSGARWPAHRVFSAERTVSFSNTAGKGHYCGVKRALIGVRSEILLGVHQLCVMVVRAAAQYRNGRKSSP
jgi:hypothetical protein